MSIGASVGTTAASVRQPHRKDRAPTRLARHGHIATHHARKLAREGQWPDKSDKSDELDERGGRVSERHTLSQVKPGAPPECHERSWQGRSPCSSLLPRVGRPCDLCLPAFCENLPAFPQNAGRETGSGAWTGCWSLARRICDKCFLLMLPTTMRSARIWRLAKTRPPV